MCCGWLVDFLVYIIFTSEGTLRHFFGGVRLVVTLVVVGSEIFFIYLNMLRMQMKTESLWKNTYNG